MRNSASRFLIYVVALFSVTSPGFAVDGNDFLAGTVTKLGNEGNDLPYRLFVPPGYKASQSYPVIIYLHGSKERGTDNKAQVQYTIQGSLELISEANQQAHPCLLLVPQMQTIWDAEKLEQIVRLIDELAGKYNIDRDRIMVAGWSAGGGGVWNFISLRPNFFSAAVPLSGANISRTIYPARITTAVWAFHSIGDNVGPISYGDDMVAALREQGRQVIYTRYATGKHAIFTEAFKTPGLLPWMMAQKRNHAPIGSPLLSITSPAGHVVSTPSETVDVSGTATIPGGVTSVRWYFADKVFDPPAWGPSKKYAPMEFVSHAGQHWMAYGDLTGKEPGALPRNNWSPLLSSQDLRATDSALSTLASGTEAWSVKGAKVSHVPGRAGLLMVMASGSTWSKLGGETTVNDYLWVAPANAKAEVPTLQITKPNVAEKISTKEATIDLSGTCTGAADKTIEEVSWSNDRGGEGVAIGTTKWSIAGIGLSPGANVITITARDSHAIVSQETVQVRTEPKASP